MSSSSRFGFGCWLYALGHSDLSVSPLSITVANTRSTTRTTITHSSNSRWIYLMIIILAGNRYIIYMSCVLNWTGIRWGCFALSFLNWAVKLIGGQACFLTLHIMCSVVLFVLLSLCLLAVAFFDIPSYVCVGSRFYNYCNFDFRAHALVITQLKFPYERPSFCFNHLSLSCCWDINSQSTVSPYL
jgi:hypothetical protein